MRVLIANPGEPAQVADLDPGLESLQAVVGGWIELWAVDGAANFLCNDEGRIMGLPFNRDVTLSDGTVWNIYGPILVTGCREDDGRFDSLPEEDLARWKVRLDQARPAEV